MTTFESSVKLIPANQEAVYIKLSDLNNLADFADRIPEGKVQDLEFDSDSVSFSISPVGKISLRIVERTPSKCVKFETVSSPLPFNLWIQIVEVSESQSKMKLTIKAELNPFIKGMVQKPLQEGLEKMADTLAMINY